jgi:hypothetical protein
MFSRFQSMAGEGYPWKWGMGKVCWREKSQAGKADLDWNEINGK